MKSVRGLRPGALVVEQPPRSAINIIIGRHRAGRVAWLTVTSYVVMAPTTNDNIVFFDEDEVIDV